MVREVRQNRARGIGIARAKGREQFRFSILELVERSQSPVLDPRTSSRGRKVFALFTLLELVERSQSSVVDPRAGREVAKAGSRSSSLSRGRKLQPPVLQSAARGGGYAATQIAVLRRAELRTAGLHSKPKTSRYTTFPTSRRSSRIDNRTKPLRPLDQLEERERARRPLDRLGDRGQLSPHLCDLSTGR